jgi:hypothetical protein
MVNGKWLEPDRYLIVSTLFYLQPSTSTRCVDIEFSSLHCFMDNLSPNKLKKTVHYLSQLESLECESRWLGKHIRVFFVVVFIIGLFSYCCRSI